MTDIVKTTTATGKAVYEIRNAVVIYVDELRTGVSTRTGNTWKIRNVNIRLDNGENQHSDFMRLTFRNQGTEEVSAMVPGQTRINVKVDFNISQGKFAGNDINVVECSIIN